MDKKNELTQIVKKVQKDKGQFELLYSKIINRVYFWCFTVVGNEAEAKDVTQDVMIRIYNKIDTVRNPEYFTSWMYKLARNYSISYLRKKEKMEYEYLYDESGESTEYLIKENRIDHVPHEAYDAKELKVLISSFIEKLPRRQREVITLFYLEEYKIEEIAEILDYNSGSVRSRLHVGRKNLETYIEKYQKENNVKLYTSAILPILGLLLNEYRNDICSNQNLSFDESVYGSNAISPINGFTGILSSKILVAIISVVIIGGLISAAYFNQEDKVSSSIDPNISFIDDVEMFNKINENPYIASIDYSNFPTSDSLEITINLKKKALTHEIKIVNEDEEFLYEIDDKTIIFNVSKNGEYSILIGSKKITFEISNIDQYAPELIEVHNYDNYMKLIIEDEKKQIDYSKSYIEHNGKQYDIDSNLEVQGNFKGETVITIYVNDNSYKKYFITVN